MVLALIALRMHCAWLWAHWGNNMPFTEDEFQQYSDSEKNIRFNKKEIISSNIYRALCVIVLDMFENYESFFMPSFFNKAWQKEIQNMMVDYKFIDAARGDVEFLKRLFNHLEICFGKKQTLLLLEWIKNSTDVNASGTEHKLSSLKYDLRTKGIHTHTMPLRLQRYFSFEKLLFDQHSGGSTDMDVDSIKTKHDQRFYALQEYDGEITFQPDSEAASLFRNLAGMIAWENACSGGKPDAAELDTISNWLAEYAKTWPMDNNRVTDLYITPLLRNDYIERRIIAVDSK
jgi:hypothetical protein